MFILIMQFLWKYIDDLVGKGLELTILLELIVYFAASIVPLALPLAVLISSVMTMGNLAESNELMSFKSAGIRLTRIFRSLIIVCFVFTIGSVAFSNYVIPVANLQFLSRLYDVRHKKPALDIKAGAFNNDFEGFSIRVGQKSDDNSTIYDVSIYDHTSGMGNDNVVVADSGLMYLSADKQYVVLKMFNGYQYTEIKPDKPEVNKDPSYEHVRTTFEVWEKLFDMTSFQMDATNKDLFKDHYAMLNFNQLKMSIDSLNVKVGLSNGNVKTYSKPYFYYKNETIDSLRSIKMNEQEVVINSDINLYEKIFKKEELHNLYKRAASNAKNFDGYINFTVKNKRIYKDKIAKVTNEVHKRFMLAFSCIVLLFIGAPMGAIIRKGGFGMPLLVSIIFFVVFHVLSFSGETLADNRILPPYIGIWLAFYVLIPIGIFLTIRATNDSTIFSSEFYSKIFRFILSFGQKKEDK